MSSRPSHPIEVESLSLRYRDGTDAVRGVDLAVPRGEIFGFLGPNGAGKSTTVRMLVTLLQPTGGRAAVAGFDVVSEAHQVRRHIGVALQEAGLNGMSTGAELLEMHARLHGMRAGRARARSRELLEVVGLTDAAGRRAIRYSGGMKRRLDLAIALVHAPSVLFLDEPTTGLDPASRHVIWEQVRRLREEHDTTVFLTTQYLDEADQLADRVAIIDHGRIVSEGTPEHLKRDLGADVITLHLDVSDDESISRACAAARLLDTVSGVSADDVAATIVVRAADGAGAAPALLGALAGADVQVTRIHVERPSLDDVFLAVTGPVARDDGAGVG